MEGDVPRGCTSPCLDEGGIVRLEPALKSVEPKDEDTVEPLVGHERETAGGIEGNMVGMRARLLALVRARLAGEWERPDARSERSVGLDRHDRQRAVGVVRSDDEAVRRVDREMDQVRPNGPLPVDEAEPPALRIDRKGADLVEIAMNRIEKPASPIDGQVRGIDQVLDELDMPPAPRCRSHPVDLDPSAARLALCRGERADIGKHGPIPPPFRPPST